MFKRRTLVSVLAGASLLVATSAFAQFAERTIKFTNGVNEDHPVGVGVKKMQEILAAKTGGKLKIAAFWGGAAGGDLPATQALRAGTQEMVCTSSSPLVGIVKELGVFDLPFLFGVLLHKMPMAIALVVHLQLHLGTLRAVAQGVVQQVAQQHACQGLGQGNAHAVRQGFAQHDALLPVLCGGVQIGRHLARHLGQWRAAEVLGGFGVEPGQLQQLLHQPGGAVAALHRGLQRRGAFLCIGGALRHLGLHADAGNGGAQLMRCVGGELLLCGQQPGHALEQLVQRRDQRQHLGRNAFGGQGCERLGLARGHGVSEPPQRPHRAAHCPPAAKCLPASAS